MQQRFRFPRPSARLVTLLTRARDGRSCRTCAATVGAILAVAGMATPAHAQSRDSLYRRAQEMVSNGDAAAGRALVDSLLSTAPEGSPQYAEAVYWRATLAADAADAEHDYQRIVVDYPRSPHADDALLRLGELELMRGDYDAALLHLQRLTRDHPDTRLRAKASYWTARAFFEKGDMVNGCAANADALAHAATSDVELKNQIGYQHQRCRNVVAQSPPANPPVGTQAAPPSGVPLPVPAAASRGGVSDASQPHPAPAPPVAASKTARSKSIHAQQASHQPTHHRTPRAVPPSTEPPAPEGAPGAFAVQVAAYYDRSQADWFVAKLRKRGYLAHVDGAAAPFRVRIGHFTTRAAAKALLAKLKAKQIDGFITQE